MNQKQRETYLIRYLLNEKGLNVPQESYGFDLYRSLVNVREASEIDKSYLEIEDEYLQNIEKNITDSQLFPNQITIWKGDITTLKVDAIVNAANSQMEGCFMPGHHCIDNAIHTYAGVRLRLECHELMKKQGFLEPIGKAKLTKAYNLPSQYIIHTVGPIVRGRLEHKHEVLLESCYESCLNLAVKKGLQSIAFCCISTGVFGYPKKEAAIVAVNTVKKFIKNHDIKVIFNVFSDEDDYIYQEIMEKFK